MKFNLKGINRENNDIILCYLTDKNRTSISYVMLMKLY